MKSQIELEIDTRIVYQAHWFWVIKENNSIVYNLTTNDPAEEKVLGSGYVSLGNKGQRITISQIRSSFIDYFTLFCRLGAPNLLAD